jgi:hypothetical protein
MSTLLQPPEGWIVNPDEQVKPQPKTLRVGFTVGIVEGTEELVFRALGAKPGLMELRGLVQYAQSIIDQSLKATVVNPEHQELLNQLKELKDRVDQLPKA